MDHFNEVLKRHGIIKDPEPKDFIVYGANCVWWDSINKASRKSTGLPACPHCDGVLFEVSSEEWFKKTNEYEKAHSGYKKFIEWLRGKCFPTTAAAYQQYERNTDGKIIR